MSESERVRPFYCGSQAADWRDRNCEGCALKFDDDAPAFRCDIERAVVHAYVDDGTVPADIARRMGRLPAETRYTWPCPEFATEDDLRERRRREIERTHPTLPIFGEDA